MKVHEVLKNDDAKYTAQDVKDVFDAWATKDDKAKGKGGTIFSLKEDGNYNVSGDPKEVAALLLEIAKQLLESE